MNFVLFHKKIKRENCLDCKDRRFSLCLWNKDTIQLDPSPSIFFLDQCAGDKLHIHCISFHCCHFKCSNDNQV